MGSNGLDLTTEQLDGTIGNCDIELSVDDDVYGYYLRSGVNIREVRANAFAGSIASGAPTYQQAGPYTRTVWENFGGGFGQEMQNRVIGGMAGIGGDASRYYHSTGWTLKGNILMPGMARNLVVARTSSNPNVEVSAEFEQPRGVHPVNHPNGAYTKFAPTGSITFTKLKILLQIYRPALTTPIVVTATIDDTHTFTASISDTTDYQRIRWVTLTGSSTTLNTSTHTLRVNYTADGAAAQGLSFGCFVADLDGTENVIQPYFQICYTSLTDKTDYDFTARAKKIERIYLGYPSVPVGIAITDSTFYNPVNDGNNRPQPALGGTYSGSLVFDNQLYIGCTSSNKTQMWSAVNAANEVASPDASTTNFAMGPAVSHKGNIYFIDGVTKDEIKKWDGTFPATATTIVASGTVGEKNTNGFNKINNLIIHKGLLYVSKPEGIFKFYQAPELISTTGETRVLKVWDAGPLNYPTNGKYFLEYQGMLAFNCLSQIVTINITDAGNEISFLVPPFLLGTYKKVFYVNGLSTDGLTLYASFNNVGVVAMRQGTWHHIFDFYETVEADDNDSGLCYFPLDSVTGPDDLFAGDGYTMIRMPIPTARTSYTRQISLADQNKGFYFITSLWDADLAEMVKVLRSITLRAAPSGYRYKIIGAFWQPSEDADNSPNSRTIIERTLHEGLARDLWINPTAPTTTGDPIPVVTSSVLDNTGAATATEAPCFFLEDEFFNKFGSKEKKCSPDDVNEPVEAVSLCFILYGWYAPGALYVPANEVADYSYIESMVLQFLATQDYIAMYPVTIDLHATTKDNAEPWTPEKLAESVTFLRSRCASRTPTRFKFYDATGTVKTVNGFIQNSQFDLIGHTTERDSTTNANTCSFTILAIDSEFASTATA